MRYKINTMTKGKPDTTKSVAKKRRNSDLSQLMDEYCRIVPGVRITNSKRLFHPTNFEYDDAGRAFIKTNMMTAMNILGFSSDEIEILDPVDIRSQRYVPGVVGEMSQKFMTLRLMLNGTLFNIVLNGGAKTSGTSARLKESIVIYFITHPELVNPSSSSYFGNVDWKSNYVECLNKIRNSLLIDSIEGVSERDNLYIIEEIDMILNNRSLLNMKMVEKTIMCSYSISRKISSMFNPAEYIFDRGEILKYVRNIAVALDGTSAKADNCYPIDIIAVKRSELSDIRVRLESLTRESSSEIVKTNIKQLFYDELDSSTWNNPIVGISLKEDSARLGRCKSAIGKITNITDEEREMTYDDAKNQIGEWRKKLKSSKIMKFCHLGDEYELDVKNYVQKYMTLKLLVHLENKMNEFDGESYMNRLIKTCIGIKNFPYVMMKGDRSGMESNVILTGMAPGIELTSSFKIRPLAKESSGFSIYLDVAVRHNGIGKTCSFIIGINGDQNSMELQSMK